MPALQKVGCPADAGAALCMKACNAWYVLQEPAVHDKLRC